MKARPGVELAIASEESQQERTRVSQEREGDGGSGEWRSSLRYRIRGKPKAVCQMS